MQNGETILIAGAGIGGLALACGLQKAELKFEVFERAPTLSPVGAGILLQPNAMAALSHLGLDSKVAQAGHQLRRGTGETLSGTVLHSTPLDGFETPTVAMRRASLQSVLLQTIGSDHVHTNKRFDHYEQDQEGVTAFFSDGSTARGTLLVGADGLRSAVRSQLVGPAPLRYAGYTSWRGIAPIAPLTPADEIFEVWGPGLRFGIVPIAPDQTYWFAVANAPEGETSPDPRSDVLARFADFGERAQKLVAATPTDQILRMDIHDRLPIRSWSEGRVVLMGDAAHPCTPNLGQGGCMAIEDAVLLAHFFTKTATYQDAIRRYETRRIPRTAAIVKESWNFGRVAQLEGRFSRWLRDLVLRSTPQSVVQKRLRENAAFSLD